MPFCQWLDDTNREDLVVHNHSKRNEATAVCHPWPFPYFSECFCRSLVLVIPAFGGWHWVSLMNSPILVGETHTLDALPIVVSGPPKIYPDFSPFHLFLPSPVLSGMPSWYRCNCPQNDQCFWPKRSTSKAIPWNKWCETVVWCGHLGEAGPAFCFTFHFLGIAWHVSACSLNHRPHMLLSAGKQQTHHTTSALYIHIVI